MPKSCVFANCSYIRFSLSIQIKSSVCSCYMKNCSFLWQRIYRGLGGMICGWDEWKPVNQSRSLQLCGTKGRYFNFNHFNPAWTEPNLNHGVFYFLFNIKLRHVIPSFASASCVFLCSIPHLHRLLSQRLCDLVWFGSGCPCFSYFTSPHLCLILNQTNSLRNLLSLPIFTRLFHYLQWYRHSHSSKIIMFDLSISNTYSCCDKIPGDQLGKWRL